MKVFMTYDGKVKALEVPEEDFAPMIEEDYKRRLAQVDDGEHVLPRTPQQILDDINRYDTNNWEKQKRHTAPAPVPYRPDEGFLEAEPMDWVADKTDIEEEARKNFSYRSMVNLLYKKLPPKEADVIIEVYLHKLKRREYAELRGLSISTVNYRLNCARKKLKGFLGDYLQ